MFTVSSQEVKKIKTQAWAANTFPAIHSEAKFAGLTVVRSHCGLEMAIAGVFVEINKQALSMGNFRLDNLEGLSHSQQQQAWAVVEEIKSAIDAVVL